MTDTATSLLFVYGTLRGDVNHRAHEFLAQNAPLIGRAAAPGHHLFDLGAYPAMAAAPPDDSGAKVIGQLFRLREPESLWPKLDAYEGAQGRDAQAPLFVRTIIMARPDSGAPRRAWAYLYARPLPPRAVRIISGDYAARLRHGS